MAEGQAFGSSQQPGQAQGVSAGSSFVAPVRPAYTGEGVLEATGTLSRGLSSLAEDKELRALGEYIAQGREAIRGTTNPVMRAQLQEKLIQTAYKRFGAKRDNEIQNGLKNPEEQTTYDPNSGEKITKRWDGSVSRESIRRSTPENEIKSYDLDQAGFMTANAPTMSRVADSILMSNVGADGKPRATSTLMTETRLVSEATNTHFGNITRLSQNIAAIKYTDPFYDEKVGKQALAQIEMGFDRVVGSLLSDNIANLITDDVNAPHLIPESLIKIYDAFVVDHDRAMQQFGASFNMTPEDVRRQTEFKRSAREKILSAYNAAAKGGLEQYKRHVDQWEQSEKLIRSEWFVKLPPEHREMILRADKMNAWTTSIMNYRSMLAMYPVSGANEQRMMSDTLGFMAPVFGWSSAVGHMGLIRSTKLAGVNEAPERAYNFVTSVQAVLSGPKGDMFLPEIKKKAAELRPSFDKLVKDNVISKEDVDRFYTQVEARAKASDDAAKKMGITPEEKNKSWSTLRDLFEQLFTRQPPRPMTGNK
jgi:hypothetical protein